ncbi:hypothetical protein F4782DRAFT_82850 [Xylaria castorea]|nr:hypothetical protein F4782DRAFT_82850 [Xylaria castorea]
MDKTRVEFFLDLSIEFDPLKICIGFQNERQAVRYHDLISRQYFTDKMKLNPQIFKRFVSVRLPSRVVQLHASTTHNGFYLCTEDADFAKQWTEALMLWNFTLGRDTHKLYLKRDIATEDLNTLLDSHSNERSPPRRREPGSARASRAR